MIKLIKIHKEHFTKTQKKNEKISNFLFINICIIKAKI